MQNDTTTSVTVRLLRSFSATAPGRTGTSVRRRAGFPLTCETETRLWPTLMNPARKLGRISVLVQAREKPGSAAP